MSHVLLTVWLALTGTAAFAVDGVLEINHVRALAGGVTTGDAPGYPVTFSQPGSYRLTGNLTHPDADTHVLLVTANDVSLDLNGYSILGGNVCSKSATFPPPVLACTGAGSGHGIHAEVLGFSVANGVIAGIGGTVNYGLSAPSANVVNGGNSFNGAGAPVTGAAVGITNNNCNGTVAVSCAPCAAPARYPHT